MKKTFFIRTYGCQMNFSESERLCELLETSGWRETKNPDQAGLIIAFGCSVRQKAENRVISFLKSHKYLKEKGTIFCLAGCTANLHKEKIFNYLPFLDIVCGPNHIAEIPEIVDNYSPGRIIIKTGEKDSPFIECIPSKKNITIMIPITKGCNNFCSYCVVPMARGKLQSRKPHSIIEEIKNAVEQGIKAITLLGQNVNEYGKDFTTDYDFSDLVCEILKIENLMRIGFVTSHPEDTSEKLLSIMAQNKKIMKHLHIPLQSGSDKILRDMNRKYTVEEFLQVVETARRLMPEISITSDIMVGFPGETKQDFEKTLSIIKEVRFNELFIFKYSPRPMTKAFELPDDVSREEKEHRHRIILETQKEISREILSSFIGKACEVLVERRSIKNPLLLIGKNIQGIPVTFKNNQNLIGKIVNVEITGYEEGILFGKVNGEYL
ncbi:MAG: tRNA (N6-isopentenyl adenosine(37)-C2)-methylthiotransferase MiaB [bacterium]|nr:tRNA (N6-isopentenyl adenosine(37)-C2)-methylthiotransferase MiaB [bacterium]